MQEKTEKNVWKKLAKSQKEFLISFHLQTNYQIIQLFTFTYYKLVDIDYVYFHKE